MNLAEQGGTGLRYSKEIAPPHDDGLRLVNFSPRLDLARLG